MAAFSRLYSVRVELLSLRCPERSLATLFAILCCLFLCGTAHGTGPERTNEWSIHSPDGRLTVTVGVVGSDVKTLRYSVHRGDRELVAPSAIRFVLATDAVLSKKLAAVESIEASPYRSDWKPVYGQRDEVSLEANELSIKVRDAGGMTLSVRFRCYNQGLAFRSQLLSDDAQQPIVVTEELSEFNVSDEAVCWATGNAQGLYHKVRLRYLPKETERPLVCRSGDAYLAITEAAQIDYPSAMLSRGESGGAVTDLQGPAESIGSLQTPWRVVLIGSNPGELVESHHVLLDLNEPLAIADPSWIRPGKVLREITLTTEGGEACIDFAVKNDFQFVEFDAGWYGHEYDDASDATTITVDPKRTPGPLDLRRLIKRANEQGVGVILYVNRRALEQQLDELLPLYKEWGVSGVKYGFVRVGSQESSDWLHTAIRKAAEHELMVDVHDEYRPVGFGRTYPNLMTVEGVRGDEAAPTAEQTLTSLFTRGIAGPTDFTICYFDDRVKELWTHAHQLAKPICFYSPWQFIYWYDTPLADGGHLGKRIIVDTPEQQLFRTLPTTWDETRVLQGEIGEYAVVARRSGKEWFLGMLNASEPRVVTMRLDFLAAGTDYNVTSYSDDSSVDTWTGVGIGQTVHRSDEEISIELLPNGGYAAHFQPSVAPKRVATSARAKSDDR